MQINFVKTGLLINLCDFYLRILALYAHAVMYGTIRIYATCTRLK